MQRRDSAASCLARCRRGLAEHERLYHHHHQWKSVTQFFPISVSLTHSVHKNDKCREPRISGIPVDIKPGPPAQGPTAPISAGR